ncbi:hypothetical protein AQ611_08955 [Burkholderia singularis]|nr:hypothetical protein AQ611_08955 [Burkholderia sp. Bp7605]
MAGALNGADNACGDAGAAGGGCGARRQVAGSRRSGPPNTVARKLGRPHCASRASNDPSAINVERTGKRDVHLRRPARHARTERPNAPVIMGPSTPQLSADAARQ